MLRRGGSGAPEPPWGHRSSIQRARDAMAGRECPGGPPVCPSLSPIAIKARRRLAAKAPRSLAGNPNSPQPAVFLGFQWVLRHYPVFERLFGQSRSTRKEPIGTRPWAQEIKILKRQDTCKLRICRVHTDTNKGADRAVSKQNPVPGASVKARCASPVRKPPRR